MPQHPQANQMISKLGSIPLPPPPQATNPSILPPQPALGPTSGNPLNLNSIMGGRNAQGGARHFQGGRPLWLADPLMISQFSSTRKISKSHTNPKKRKISQQVSGKTAMNETDSNADTCCLGCKWTIYNYTTRSADVYSYDSSYEPIKDMPIVSGATAYTYATGMTYILIINEALYYGDKLDHSLINPNQIRHNNIGYWNNPYDQDNPLSIEIPDTLSIPLNTKGTKILFETRTPTTDELENCLKIELTSMNEWNPHTLDMSNKQPIDVAQVSTIDNTADGLLLSTISPSLTSLKECIIQ